MSEENFEEQLIRNKRCPKCGQKTLYELYGKLYCEGCGWKL
jgi:hypothetical protein